MLRPTGAAAVSTLLDLSVPELEAAVAALGYPPYRARQLFHWLHGQGTWNPGQMTDLPAELRARLAERYPLPPLAVVRALRSHDNLTGKLLLRLADGQLVETVVMDAVEKAGRARRTVCVSTQAGCAMGCVFCATGQLGFARHLSAGEIVAQVYLARQGGERPITNVVLMGMGEPLANYEQTLKAVHLLHDPHGLHFSARGITLSTVGLVPQIQRLAREGLAVNLAISLHAPNDELRSRLMPVNRRWPISELVAAGDAFAARTGRRVSYEYALIRGVNDRLACAQELGRLLTGRLCHVNLIPLNPTLDRSLHGTDLGGAQAFRSEVLRAGVACTVRVNRGRDIDAACGQLRLREEGTAANPDASSERER